jgi:hypothetical protein
MIPVQSNYEMGRTEQDGRVYLDFARRFTLGTTAWDAAHKFFIPVEKDAKVLDVRVLVASPLDAGTTLKVGDAATTDGYLKIGDLDPAAAAGTFERSFRKGTEDGLGVNTFNVYAEGKCYVAAGGLIVLELSAGPTQGRLEVEVVQAGYADVAKDVVS